MTSEREQGIQPTQTETELLAALGLAVRPQAKAFPSTCS